MMREAGQTVLGRKVGKITRVKNDVLVLHSTSDKYDVSYALRLCIESQLLNEAVYLYTCIGQHETAVDLALTIDIELAAKCAGGQLSSIHKINEEDSRKLWLKVVIR